MAYSGRDLSRQIIDGRYRVEYPLGRGGMGSVWSVQHVESLKHFALKTLESELAADPNARDRLLREARAAAALRSRHVVQVVDSRTGYVHDGSPLPFLVMERLEGLTLEQRLATRGPLNAGQVLWLMRQVGRALTEAHAHGIVHRDLKPSNVFITLDEDGAPLAKLCDFGIAKLTASAAAMLLNSTGARTSTGDILGTPLYLAPELLRSAAQATPATDQWALGLTVFKALTGREYFGNVASGPDLVLRIAQDPLPAPTSLAPELPAVFDAWFLRSCARIPERRFESVATQMQQLEVALSPVEPEAIPIGGVELAETAPGRMPPPKSAPQSAPAPAVSTRSTRPGLLLAMAWALAGSVWFLWQFPSRNARTASATEPSASEPSTAAAPSPTAAPTPATPLGTGAAVQDSARATPQPPPVVPALPLAATPHTSSVPGARFAAPAAGSPRTVPSGAVSGRVPAERAPAAPASSNGRPEGHQRKAGEGCRRSTECESGLCVAEECR